MKARILIAGLMALGLAACFHDDDDGGGSNGQQPGPGERTAIFGVNEGDELVGFFADRPGQFLSRVQLSGLVVDDPSNPPFALSMDIRPASGEIYLLYSDYRLYVADPGDGSLQLVGRALAELGDDSIDIRSMDFDPATDEIRLLDVQTGENYRISPADAGLIAQDTSLAYAVGDENEGGTVFAHGLSYDGPGSNGERTAYVMDQFQDVLARLGTADDTGTSARNGQLTTIGAWDRDYADAELSVESVAPVGYAVAASATVDEQNDLLRIDLTDASSVNLGRIGNESGRYVILAFTVVPGTGGGSGPTPSPSASPGPSPSPSPSPDPGASPSPSPSESPGGGEGEYGPLTQQCIDEGTSQGFPEEEVILFCTTVFGPIDDAGEM